MMSIPGAIDCPAELVYARGAGAGREHDNRGQLRRRTRSIIGAQSLRNAG